MKLTIQRSAFDSDWWVIERAEHNNTRGLGVHPTLGCTMLMYSGRISDADVEGTGEEMRAIAKAIKERAGVRFKRCAVNVWAEADRVEFCSPRNSTVDGECTLAEADELADLILATVPV